MIESLKRKLRGEEGLTLVEVLASVGILSITLLAIVTMYRFNYISSVDTLRQTVATNLARQGIEDLREAVIDLNKDYDYKITFDNVEYAVDMTISSIENDMYEVQSKVTWDNPFGGKRSVEFKLQRN